MNDFSVLEKKLNLNFNDKELLKKAFCHRSYINENSDFELGNNERLEFLGDAVLELAVTKYLFNNYDNTEGELTTWRAALVNSQNLGKIAKDLGFGEYIMLSRGEEKDKNEKARNFILADALEAFIGALYIDKGYKETEKFIEKRIIKELPQILKEGLWRDNKSRFQEISQEREKVTPSYKILEETGPDHKKYFVAGVFWGDTLVAKGEGSSKQEAEESAAENALREQDTN